MSVAGRNKNSKISKEGKERTLLISKRMTAEGRLVALVNHCKFMSQIHQAGVDYRARRKE